MLLARFCLKDGANDARQNCDDDGPAGDGEIMKYFYKFHVLVFSWLLTQESTP
jgi:hypothetical protein